MLLKADLSALGAGGLVIDQRFDVSQLIQIRLIDEYQIVINPIALGKGRTFFDTVESSVPFELTNTRAFANGNVVLWYELAHG